MAGYNWFMENAKSNLFLLLKIDKPTPEQQAQAERFISSTAGYARSLPPVPTIRSV